MINEIIYLKKFISSASLNQSNNKKKIKNVTRLSHLPFIHITLIIVNYKI